MATGFERVCFLTAEALLDNLSRIYPDRDQVADLRASFEAAKRAHYAYLGGRTPPQGPGEGVQAAMLHLERLSIKLFVGHGLAQLAPSILRMTGAPASVRSAFNGLQAMGNAIPAPVVALLAGVQRL